MSEDPFEFATGTVQFGDGSPIPTYSFTSDQTSRPTYAFAAGSLDVHATITGDLFADLIRLPGPPRYDMRFDYPEGADRHCPVCKEHVEAVVFESARISSSDPAEWDGNIHYGIVGYEPAAYRCEPCGHRFDRDGKEIGDE